MSETTPAIDRAVNELKQGVASVTAAHTKAAEQAATTARAFTAFGQGSFEALMQAGQIWATGSQDLARQMAMSGQTAFSEALSGFRALASAPSLKDRIELQASLARTTANWAVSESSRFAHAGLELAEKASAPLTASVVTVAERFPAK